MTDYENLRREALRQKSALEAIKNRSPRLSLDRAQHDGVDLLRLQVENYLEDLSDIIDYIDELNAGGGRDEEVAVPPYSRSTLVKLAAFASDGAYFDEESQMDDFQRLHTLRAGGSLPDVHEKAGFTEDIWSMREIQSWVEPRNESSILILWSNSASGKRLETFGFEMVKHLQELNNKEHLERRFEQQDSSTGNRLVYILGPLSQQVKENTSLGVNQGAGWFLRQMILRLLRQISQDDWTFFRGKFAEKMAEEMGLWDRRVGMMHAIGAPGDVQEAFESMRSLVNDPPGSNLNFKLNLYMVLDLNVLGPSRQEASSWPARFESILNSITPSSRVAKLKILLITNQTGECGTSGKVTTIPIHGLHRAELERPASGGRRRGETKKSRLFHRVFSLPTAPEPPLSADEAESISSYYAARVRVERPPSDYDLGPRDRIVERERRIRREPSLDDLRLRDRYLERDGIIRRETSDYDLSPVDRSVERVYVTERPRSAFDIDTEERATVRERRPVSRQIHYHGDVWRSHDRFHDDLKSQRAYSIDGAERGNDSRRTRRRHRFSTIISKGLFRRQDESRGLSDAYVPTSTSKGKGKEDGEAEETPRRLVGDNSPNGAAGMFAHSTMANVHIPYPLHHRYLTPRLEVSNKCSEIEGSWDRCPQVPRTRNDFQVGILCALVCEADAVVGSFDNHWDEIEYGKVPSDENEYSFGSMGKHNVVLVHMGKTGKVPASSAARNLKSSFGNIRLALVVGTCGGVPVIGGEHGKTNLFLGDVVISEGIVRFDFGREYSDGFVRKNAPEDILPPPDGMIQSLLAKLKTRRERAKLQAMTDYHLNELRRKPLVQDMAQYPREVPDRVFEANYRHKHRNVDAAACSICARCDTPTDPVCEESTKLSCDQLGCEDSHAVPRNHPSTSQPSSSSSSSALETTMTTLMDAPLPSIHFGLFASGDAVMKSSRKRDALAKSENIIAFEMEGAGAWDCFQTRCLVIKAICNYADSHKSKAWQNYAASTSAACAKAFLKSWKGDSDVLRQRGALFTFSGQEDL